MSAYSGSALYVEYVNSAGTFVPSADFRTFEYTPSLELIEDTAGADPNKTYIPSVKDGVAELTFIQQADGTVLLSGVLEGLGGTLTWAPEGTATGNEKHQMPVISQGAQSSIPYRGVVEITVTWQQNGARTDTTY